MAITDYRALRYLPVHLQSGLESDHTEAMQRRCAAHLSAVLQAVIPYLPVQIVCTRLTNPAAPPVQGEFVHGTVMFADISGFTAMSERLSQLGREGAEVITGIVNDYFATMLDIVLGHGGDLFKFGGDAILVAFLGAEGAPNACRAALAMQQAMSRFAEVSTPQGTFNLRVTIGLGSGLLFTASLGTPQRLEFAVMGPALVQMARAEDAAEPGEVILDKATWTAAGAVIVTEPLPDDLYRLMAVSSLSLVSLSPHLPVSHSPHLLDLVTQLDALSPYLPASLLERIVASPPPLLETTGSQVMTEGEHRLATVLFANLYGIDEIIEALGSQHLDKLTAVLNQHFTAMQAIIEKYEGIVNKLDTYAVGYRIMAIFGAPRAHEDDPARAVRAALEMQQEISNFKFQISVDTCTHVSDSGDAIPQSKILKIESEIGMRIGINTGYVFAGNLGSPLRQEYTVMGDEVNLTSRLMGVAGKGQVLISHSTARQIQGMFELREREAVHVKGKQSPVANYDVIGAVERPSGPVTRKWKVGFVGRQREIEQARARVDAALSGQGQILDLCGEAGVGKTRLVKELGAYARAGGMDIVRGEALAYGRGVPYLPWMNVLRYLFGMTNSDAESKRSSKSEQLAATLTKVGLEIWSPVAAGVLGLDIPDNEITAALEPRLRRERFFDVTFQMLQARAARRPVMIVLDDMHWADETSVDLLSYLARNLEAVPALVTVLHRPEAETECALARQHDYMALPYCTSIMLSELDDTYSRQLIRSVLQAESLPDDLYNLVMNRAQGNPLFLEEVVRTLVETGLVQSDNLGNWTLTGRPSAADVPTTLQGLLMSRIDRLEEVARRVLQVSSVIGRTFAYPVLSFVYPYNDLEDTLPSRLGELIQVDLVLLGRSIPELEYLFKHTLTQEVAYQSLLFARRRDLHRKVGEYIEQIHTGNLAEYYGILARHFDEGQVWPKAFAYTVKAAGKARAEYANEAALAYYRRALEIAQREALPDVQIEALHVREAAGDVCTLVGRYPEAIEQYQAGIVLPECSARQQAELWRKIAKACELQGKFDEALDCLQHGRAALSSNERCLEMARLYNLMGWVRMRQGNYDEAIVLCGEGLDILADLAKNDVATKDEAELYNTMGGIRFSRGEYSQAAEFYRRSAQLCEQINDLQGLARAYNNLAVAHGGQSEYALATEYIQRSLEIAQKIGDNYGIAMRYSNLGVLSYQAGDHLQAIEHYQQSVKLRQRIGDAWGLAYTYNNLGEVYLALKEYASARYYLEQAVATFQAVGSEAELAEVYWLLAKVHLAQNELGEATSHIERALEIAARANNLEGQGIAYRIQGQILAQMNQPDKALGSLQQSVELLLKTENQMELGKSHYELGILLSRMPDRRDEMIEHLQRAIDLFAALGATREEQQARQALANDRCA